MIFVSHSTQDDPAVDRITQALDKAGFPSWVDHQNGIEPGTPSWDRAIREAIKACDYGILIMSPRSLASDICAAECLLVRELGKPLYVLQLEKPEPVDVWLYIKLIQYADLASNFHKGMQALIDALGGKIGETLPKTIRARITGSDTMLRTLPYLNNPLRGRDKDIETIQNSLGAHVFQIVGTGGLGKSRLTAEVALNYQHGAVWHRCSTASEGNDVIQLLRRHFKLAEDASRDAVLAKLDSDTPLFVIDNAEDVTGANKSSYLEVFSQLIDRHVPIILTTRRIWNELKPRREHAPAALSAEIGAQIALDFAASDNIALTSEKAKTLAEKARLHPRLIEFAVGQLHERSFERVMKQLDELKHDDVKDALNEMINKTVKQMAEQAKNGANAERLLKRLTILQGTFSFDAARALAPTDLQDEDDLEDALVTMRRWQFVRRVGERDSLTELVREAMGIPNDEEIFNAYADFFTTRAREIFALTPEQWREHDADQPDITVLGDVLQIRTKDGTAGDLKRAMNFAIRVKSYVAQRREARKRSWLEMGLNAVRALQTGDDDELLGRQEALFLNEIGLAWSALGEKRKALEFYEQALPLRKAVRDQGGEATTLTNIGSAWSDLGETRKALEFYEQALPLREAVNDPRGKATTLTKIGRAWSDLGEKHKALEFYEQALPLRKAVNDPRGEATTLNNIGKAWFGLGEKHKALEFYEQALLLRRDIVDKRGEATTLNNIGKVWFGLGENQKALDFYEQALPLRRDVGDRSGEATTCFNIGMVYRKLGNLVQAIGYVEHCVQLEEEIEHHNLENDRRMLEQLKHERDGDNSS